nr:hypothetical protein CFP56_17254 [Quercus suber]
MSNGAQNRNNIKLSGTLGYVAPEYLLDAIYLLLLQFGFGSSTGNTCLIYLLLHTSRATIYLLLLQDIHPVQQSPALQKSSATSHQPSYL